MPIPKKIHQIWIQGESRVPWHYRLTARTWRTRNPAWDYHLWDDNALRTLIQNHCSELLPVYQAYKSVVARADIGRYVLLHAFGGVYVDMDTECIRPIDHYLTEKNVNLYVQVYDNPAWQITPDTLMEHISNALIACPPAHGIWQEVFQYLQDHEHPDPIWIATTGPEMFSQSLKHYLTMQNDVYFFTRNRIITAYYLPRHYMRWYAWKHHDVFAVHYNDSARLYWRPALVQRLWPFGIGS